MSHTGKWIEGLRPDGDVSEAARVALGERLAAVVHWLPAAAYCAEHDVEHVHRLRVTTRRAVAALRLFRDFVPPKRARRVKKWLRKIRKAAGDARDLDVLIERLGKISSDEHEAVVRELNKRRADVQPAIVRVADRARRRNRFARKIDRLLTGINPRRKSEQCAGCDSFRHWAQHRMAELADEFFTQQPTRDDGPAALHQFRIRAKALRYAIELLAPAFGEELRERHYPIVEELQERLGHISDHATAAARLKEWSESECNADRRRQLSSMADKELGQLGVELREFHQWWTAERAEALRDGLLPDGQRTDRTALA